ncbi:hypothetical protein SPHINGOT1_270109 [Sphingomonas sp. T1]|nr:hypothetical protein SPHINGOT1_270109 [Sphingomonas sp. T1]
MVKRDTDAHNVTQPVYTSESRLLTNHRHNVRSEALSYYLFRSNDERVAHRRPYKKFGPYQIETMSTCK